MNGVKLEAKVALSKGAKLSGTGIYSGEEGILPEEHAANSRGLYKRASAGIGFSMEKLKDVQAFHFKCGQAGKTGTGGHLPGPKVQGKIAEVRGLAPGGLRVPSDFAKALDSGTWTKKSFKIKGSWSIEKLEDGSRELRLSEDFKTRRAPDLKLIFHPLGLSSINNKNALTDAVVLELLTSHTGAQTYILPSDLDLSTYKCLIIHYEEYRKLWGGTALKP